MKKITILIVMAVLCLFFKGQAQSHLPFIPLKVGDKMPDLIINNVVNYKTKSIRLSDYKDRLVILDYWMTTCIPCIEHMPILYSLQKKFGDKLFILPFNSATHYDPPAKVAAFFKERRKVFDLPSVVMDTVLYHLFQPPYLGFCIWLKNGVIQQITNTEEVTEINISKALQSNDVQLIQFARPSNDDTKPLFDGNNGSKMPQKYFMRSILFPYTPSLGIGYRNKDSTGKVTRISINNVSVYSLLMFANPDYNYFPQSRTRLYTKRITFATHGFDTDSARQVNEYCYEAIFPPVSNEKVAKYIKEDISRYFHFKLDSISIVDSCWVLTLSNTKKLKIGDPKDSETNIEASLGLPIYYRNHALSFLAEVLENENKVPFLNETGINPNLWLNLPANLTDLKVVKKSLEKQGLIMKKELRPVEYLIIKDQPESN